MGDSELVRHHYLEEAVSFQQQAIGVVENRTYKFFWGQSGRNGELGGGIWKTHVREEEGNGGDGGRDWR